MAILMRINHCQTSYMKYVLIIGRLTIRQQIQIVPNHPQKWARCSIFMIMHSFPDIEEIRFFDNGVHYYLHIHETTFFDHENISEDTLVEMI